MRRLTLLVWAGVAIATSAALAGPAEDPDRRAAATEARLTDAERFGLLHGVMPLAIPGMPVSAPPGVPSTAGYVHGVARLGIPDLVETDASLGVTNPLQTRPGDVATAMPSGLALAASFDPALAAAGGAMMGSEALAKGFNILLGGGVNLARDPRNGRNFEYLGEDPLLAGILAGESIRGVQSAGVVSTVKHFALNAQETLRQSLNAEIAEAGLRESDLLAFELAIERGQPGSVMCAYNKIGGAYACGNDHLLNGVLKKDWGYRGWVMSDWGAVHDVSYFAAGLDQQSGSQLDKQVWFDDPLKAEVASGHVSRERLSDAVRRILRGLYAVGADRPVKPQPIDYAEHAKVARQEAAEGIVLLKNEGALPLKPSTGSILVIGGHADIGVMSGGGSSQVTPAGGDSTVIPLGGAGFMGPFVRQLIMPSSPLRALKARLPDRHFEYDSGYYPLEAAARAAKAEQVILFATQWQTEGYDADSLSLPEGQDRLIAAVAKANSNVVVVLETGNPVTMPWLDSVKAVIEAWYPGQEGGAAIADILTGAVNPSGHLPITFPMSERQNPRPAIPGLGEKDGTEVEVVYSEGADIGYRWFAAHGETPLFPFGYGLSYTSFEHNGLTLKGDPAIAAHFVARNSGECEGSDLAQLYLVEAAGKTLKRLAGFQRLTLKPGESREVGLTVDPRLLAHWNGDGWRIDPGRYGFALASSAGNLGPTTFVTLGEHRLKP